MDYFSKLLNSHKASKLFFYPSCGCDNIFPQMFNIDCEIFVFTDYIDHLYFLSGSKKGVTLVNINSHIRKVTVAPAREQVEFLIKFTSKLRQADSHFHILHQDQLGFHFSFRNKDAILLCVDNNIGLSLIMDSGSKISYFIGVNDGCQEGGNYECVNSESWLNNILDVMHPDGLTYITDHFEHYWQSTEDPPYIHSNLNHRITSIKQLDWMLENSMSRNPFPGLFRKDMINFIYKIRSGC